MNYSNPRTHATIKDWPSGNKRVIAFFVVETHPKHGERVVRTTTGAPKKTTYATKVRIVDGDDGRTYIAELTSYGFITIMRGDLKFEQETIHQNNPRYFDARALFY